MRFSYTGWAHQQQTLLAGARIFTNEALRHQIGLLQRLRVLRGPYFSVGQVGDVALKIAMFVALGKARAMWNAVEEKRKDLPQRHREHRVSKRKEARKQRRGKPKPINRLLSFR